MDLDIAHTPWARDHWVRDFALGDMGLGYLDGLLDLSRELDFEMHFFALGMGVIEYPECLMRIIDAGHALDSHLHTHRVQLIDDFSAVHEEFHTAKHLIESLGMCIEGLGAPGMHPRGLEKHPRVRRLLLDQGMKWVSSEYNRDRKLQHNQPHRYCDGLLEIPCSGWSDMGLFYYRDECLNIQDCALPNTPGNIDAFIDHLKDMIRLSAREGLVYVPCLHPGPLAQRDPQMRLFREIIPFARSLGIDITNMRKLAAGFPGVNGDDFHRLQMAYNAP